VRFGLRSEVAGRSKAGADVSAESICNHSSVVRVEAMLLSTCERGKMGQLECVKEGPDRGLTRYVRCLGTAPPLPRRNTPTFDDESTRRASGKYNSSTDPLRNASNASSCFDENPIRPPENRK